VKQGTAKVKVTARAAGFLYRMRRRAATVAAVILAIFFGYHVISGQNGIQAYEQKRLEDSQLKQQIDDLQQENGRLQQHVSDLKDDPDAIEREARERLHYARPGEVIYTLNNSPASAPANPSSQK
jgi:cell division protein FtsB